MIIKLAIGVAIFFDLYLFASIKSTILPTRAIEIPKHLNKELKKDVPFKGLTMSNSSEIWLLGQRNIWRYRYKTDDLTKISIPIIKDGKYKLKQLLSTNDHVYVVLNKEVLQIDTSKLTTFSYYNNNNKSYSLGFVAAGHIAYWLTNKGIYFINVKGKKQVQYKAIDYHLPKDKIVILPKGKKIWFARNNKIKELDFSQKRIKQKNIFSADIKFSDIKKLKDSIIAYTKYSIFQFNFSGNLVKHIPIAGTHSLAAVFYDDKQHGYLLEKGILEVKKLDKKITYNYKINSDSININSFQIKDNMISFLKKGQPYLFEMSEEAKL
jgi:hypothetical protein